METSPVNCNVRNLTAAVAVMTLTSGCYARIGDLSVMSSKNVPIRPTEQSARVMGQHCPAFTRGDLEEAFDRAVEQAGPQYNAMVDVVVSNWGHCFRVEGTPVILQ